VVTTGYPPNQRLLASYALGCLRQGEGNETCVSADCWSTRRASGKFLHLDAAVSSADTGGDCGNAKTKQAQHLDAAAQSAHGSGSNKSTSRDGSGVVFSEIGGTNTLHIVVVGE
jgi:hypothetical protein